LFTDIEIISIGEVTNVRGTTVILGYIYVILLLLSTLIASLINIKQIDKRYMVVFLITLSMGALLIVTAIVPGILIYSVCLALLCYIMFFTIENPDVEMIKQLNIAKSEAERANMAKSDFLSSMSHEIRTPLNAIVGLSEDIFGSNELPESLKEDCEDILTASNILQELIGNIIDFNKIENQKLTMSLVNYNLIKEIDSLVRINSTRIGTKNIKINTTYADDLPYELYGDKIHMKQIINNLLSNAVKYTDEGSIDVNVKCTNRGKTSILQISVKDTGKGIKPEDINKLFDKFERLDIQKTSTIEGSGLGLAITKYLVERMEGRINVQSDYGKGSSFVVTIPQAIHVFEKPVDAPVVTNLVDPTKFYNKKLLIVDDNTLNIKVAKKALKDFKFIIDECSNGVECLEKIKTNTYDLILLDIMMPVMDGKEVIKKLKANPDFKTPVIALTADAVSEAKEKYIKMGFNEYIAKPFNKEQIKIKLNDIFK
jgi:signal transduction histidine kinase/CheY-like chemotaxis protein